jgi:hypothetical protein
MWCWLHFKSTCSHVFASWELHIGHVIDGNLSMPKNSCFLAFPMYCPVWNFSMLVFCEFVIVGLDQNLLDIPNRQHSTILNHIRRCRSVWAHGVTVLGANSGATS